MEEFEIELRLGLERRPAPPGLKRKVMERRSLRQPQQRRGVPVLWMRLAASLAIVAILAGGADWGVRRVQERRRAEEIRQQVFKALRITNHALNEVQSRLAAHDRADRE